MKIMQRHQISNISWFNTFYTDSSRRVQVLQELRLNLRMLRLGCSTIRGYKINAIEDFNIPSKQRGTMISIKRNLIWIWQVLVARKHGARRHSLYCRGLLRAQMRLARWCFKRLVYETRTRFRSRRWRRVIFFKDRIRYYSKYLNPRATTIMFLYRKRDASRITGNPMSLFENWAHGRFTQDTPQKILGSVYTSTRLLSQGLLNTIKSKNIALHGYHATRKLILTKPKFIGGRTMDLRIRKLLRTSIGFKPKSIENLRVLQFLSNTVELSAITKLEKLQYNALTVSCAMYIHTKMNLLGYFHTDFDLAFGIDFKSYVVRMVLNLFNSVVSMYDYMGLPEFKKVQPEAEHSLPKPRTISREIFLKEFGMYGLRGEKLPYRLIKFRPGYQIFFRQLRDVHKELNHLRFRYQHRMTTYLLRFQHLNNAVILKLSMLSIKQVLLHTRLFINQGELEHAIKYGFIFINGRACTGLEFQLQVGDYVQYKATYFTYSDVLNIFRARAELLGRGHGILGHYTFGPFMGGTPFNPRHGMTNPVGKLVFNKFHLHRLVSYYYNFFDTPAYIELDYMLLGFVVVTLPNSTSDYEFIMARKSSVTMLKMLNWKYIV